MRPYASPTKSIDDAGQQLPATPLTEHDVAILHEIVKLADSASDFSAHPRKVLFDAYHTIFKQYGLDTSRDKACLRILLSLAGPHLSGDNLTEKFKGIIRQAGFELEYTDDDLHIDQVAEIGEQTLAESEAIVRSLQQQHVGHGKQEPALAELEDPTQDHANRPRNSRSVPDFGRGSQESGEVHGHLAAMPYSAERPDPYAMPHAHRVSGLTQTGSVTDNQTEDVVFPAADQAVIQQFMRRMNAMEDLAVAKDANQLKVDSFRIWRSSTREKKAADFYRKKLLSRVTSHISSRQHDDYTANALYRESLAKRSKETLQVWRAETRLRPIEQRVSYRHDVRLAQQVVGDLRTLVRLPGHAEAVREEALRRKGFDAWGEELRIKAIAEKIDYRLLISSMYKWTLATRESLLRRQLDQRRARRAMQTMLAHYRQQHDQLRAAESKVVASKRLRRIIGGFLAMSSKLDQQRRHEHMADQFYHPKIEFDQLLLWKDRLSDMERLKLRADDAREFFLSIKFLKIWQTRTKESKEQRLNQAYKQIRRKGKIRIVRAGLNVWRSESDRMYLLEGIGQNFTNQREHRLVRKHFVRWRNTIAQTADMANRATTHFEARLASQCFPPIIARAKSLQIQQHRADEFHAIHTSDLAARQLRKLNTKAFELRRREQDADAMKDRHEKSHYRSMLRLWARKAAAGPDGDSSLLQPPILDNPDEEADRIMDQSLLPDIEDDETMAPPGGVGANTNKKRTPIPEYLHTPSNRAARVRRLATSVNAASTTPVAAPPSASSFAARLLAGGISLTPSGGRGRGLPQQ